MTPNKKEPAKTLPKHMVKGNLVEQIIAALHDEPDVLVRPKVKLRSRTHPKNKREIDVLVTGQILGHPMHLAFECKNYAEKIGVGRIDEFKGKLEDVGIPVQYGIFVSARGFTRDAKDRAASLRMRLLLLEGLTEDRLATEVHAAFQSLIYLLLSVKAISVTNEAADARADEMLFLRDESGNVRGGILDLIWARWRDGMISRDLGEHELDIEIPKGWQWIVGGVSMPSTAKATVSVTGHVVTVQGRAERLALRDATTSIIERGRISSSFDTETTTTYPVTTVNTEAELQTALDHSGVARVSVGRIPLPRIRFNCYWPPSDRVLLHIKRRAAELISQGQPLDLLSTIPFTEFEGTDLSTVWEPVSSGHPASQDEQWPWTRARRTRSSRPSVSKRKTARRRR